MRLVLADDSPDDVEISKEILKELDPTLPLEHVGNGEELLAWLRSQADGAPEPCVVVLDLNMPLMDGRTALKAMREDPGLSEIPVVVMSGSREISDRRFCADMGKCHFVTKPYRLEEWEAIYRGILARYRD